MVDSYRSDAATKAEYSLGFELTGPFIHKVNHTALVIVTSRELADRIFAWCGEYSHTKKITKELRSFLGKEGLLHLLGSYIDGDGHNYKSGKNLGRVRVRSCNFELLRTVRDVCLSVGISASLDIDCPFGKANKLIKNTSPSGIVGLTPNNAEKLSKYSFKCLESKTLKKVLKKSSDAIFYNGVWMFRVKSVEESENVSTCVYNLEVEDDHSYQVYGINTHNCNKDPSLAKGKVLHSVWNEKMKRVELVVGINPNLDPDAATSLDNGESLCFSMGARLPYDVCSVCQNKARTRAEYCDHLRYQLNQIDPSTGLMVGAINPFPKFFDISRVLIPADKTAYMWEKIASAANHPLYKVSSAKLAQTPVSQWSTMKDAQLNKTASVNKSAEIKKQILAVSNPIAVEKLKLALSQVKHALDLSAQPLPEEVFGGTYTPNQLINSMALLGIVPTATERELLVDMFTGTDSVSPHIQTGPGQMSIALIKALAPYAEDRSFFRPTLLRRLQARPELKKEGSATLVGAGIATGVLAALGAMFGITGSMAPEAAKMTKEMPKGMASLIAEHPVLAGVMAALIMNKLNPVNRTTSNMVVDGNFTVADPTQGLYNNDWQRRFIQMQNRPATVIKTGAALKQAETLVSPLTYLIMTSDLVKQAEEQHQWDLIADRYLTHLQSRQFQEIIKSASTVAPGEDLSFVVPEVGDLNILKKILS